jgi:hypothetical protein
MKAKSGATFLAAAFLAALVIPSTVLAGGGGGGRGGGGAGGMSGMGGASIRNQTRMENQIRTPDVEQLRMRDGKGDRVRSQDRDRDRDRIHKVAGTAPAATTTGSAVSATGEKSKKGNTYGPGDGTGPSLPKDGTGYGAPANR